jgi:sugar fermentation stimulation protein A
MVVVVPNPDADRFIPNVHTDPLFTAAYLSEMRVQRRVFSLSLTDPVTPDVSSFREIPVDWETVRSNLTSGGSYLLVLRNTRRRCISVGRLGDIPFEPGYYVYAGSALTGLEKRIDRHRRVRKNIHWHIDYLTTAGMPVVRDIPIRRPDKIERRLARDLAFIADGEIAGFGSSDSDASSHLFRFEEPPHRLRLFQDLVYTYKTFTDAP